MIGRRWATVLAMAAAAPGLAQVPAPADHYVRATLDPAATRAVAGINRFSLDLYKRLIPAGGNLFVSPASVSTALGLAYRGARGTTADELRAALHLDALPEAYLPADGALLKTLNFSADGRESRVADTLWVQQGMSLRPDYVADMAHWADAGLRQIDFRQDPDAARATINRAVASATNDRIKDLLHQGDITRDTRLALVNSIYWKGRWETGFDPHNTSTAPFHTLAGREVPTALMHQRATFPVVERDGVKAIALPYGLGEVAMIVFLPDRSSALSDFEARLDDPELNRWLASLDAAEARDTILTLPKMHLEWRGDLVPTLRDLGAKAAFEDAADFSGIAPEPQPGEVPGATGLEIAHVIHQTWLTVDETGSEAAAATAVLMEIVTTGRRGGPPPPPPIVFRADKPFLFLLRDRRTGVILFIGRYVAPPTP